MLEYNDAIIIKIIYSNSHLEVAWVYKKALYIEMKWRKTFYTIKPNQSKSRSVNKAGILIGFCKQASAPRFLSLSISLSETSPDIPITRI
jgi:hypothetical protein